MTLSLFDVFLWIVCLKVFLIGAALMSIAALGFLLWLNPHPSNQHSNQADWYKMIAGQGYLSGDFSGAAHLYGLAADHYARACILTENEAERASYAESSAQCWVCSGWILKDPQAIAKARAVVEAQLARSDENKKKLQKILLDCNAREKIYRLRSS